MEEVEYCKQQFLSVSKTASSSHNTDFRQSKLQAKKNIKCAKEGIEPREVLVYDQDIVVLNTYGPKNTAAACVW